MTHRPWHPFERLTLCVIAVLVCCIMFRPLLFSDPAFFYFDDFFYYLVPAKHWLARGELSLFPGMPTNGFQPLWMSIITGLLALSHGSEAVFFTLFNAVVAALLFAGALAAMQLVKTVSAHWLMPVTAALLVSAMQLLIATTGMEVVLTVPLLLWLTQSLLTMPLKERSHASLAAMGLLASLTVLARLDSALLLLPLMLWILLRERPSLLQLFMFAIGASPLWLTLVANLWFTGHLLPVSGQAKMLKPGWWPSLAPLAGFFDKPDKRLFFSVYGCIAIIALLTAHRNITVKNSRRLWLCIAGIAVYYAAYCVLSDWQLWFWYMYPLAWLAALSCLALTAAARTLQACVFIIALLMLPAPALTLLSRTPDNNIIYQFGLRLREFAATHPGVYAVGDYAGIASYLLDGRVIPIEGLAGDTALLEQIRNRTPLAELLKHYRADYYVSNRHLDDTACSAIREPQLAGNASPVMEGQACPPALLAANPGYSCKRPVMTACSRGRKCGSVHAQREWTRSR